jgi:hypothetical protein
MAAIQFVVTSLVASCFNFLIKLNEKILIFSRFVMKNGLFDAPQEFFFSFAFPSESRDISSYHCRCRIVKVSEIDPICAMQACMDGFEIVSPYKKGENTIIKLNNHFYCHF